MSCDEEASQTGLGLVECGHADPGIDDGLSQGRARGPRVDAGRQPDEHPVADAAAEAHEPAALERLGREEHARPQRDEAGRAIRLGLDHAPRRSA